MSGLWTGLRRLAAPVALVALVLFSVVASTGLLIVHGLDTTVGRWDRDVEQRLAEGPRPSSTASRGPAPGWRRPWWWRS